MKLSKLIRILASIIVAYTVLGFFLIPLVLQIKTPTLINERINNKIAMSKISFNPYTLKLKIFDINIHNEKESLIYVKRVIINFSLFKSLHEQHISFEEIKIIEPSFNIIQNKQKEINILSLLKITKDVQNEKESDKTDIFPFKITKTSIINADFKFTNFVNDKKEILSLNKLNYTFYELGTYKNSLASHSLSTMINKDTKLKIDGGFNLNPFRIYGQVAIKDLKPREFIGLSKEKIDFDISNTAMDLKFGYELDLREELKLSINNANIHIRDFSAFLKKKEIISFKTFDIKNLNIKYPEQTISIDEIILDNAVLVIEKNKDKLLNLQELFKENKKSKKDVKEAPLKEDFSWKINIKDIKLNNNNITYNDLVNKSFLSLKNLNMKLQDSSFFNNTFKLKNFEINNKSIYFKNKNNTIKSKTLNLSINDLINKNDTLEVKKIILENSELIFQDKLNKTDIKSSKIKVNIFDIQKGKNSISVKKVNFRNKILDVKINDKELNILSKNLNVFINKISYKNQYLKIDNSYILKPYAKIILAKQDKTPISKEKFKKKGKASSSFSFDIGPLKIKDASFIFEDHNLLIPFKTNITKVQGSLSEISSLSSRPTKIKMQGEVDKYGYTNITGFLEYKDIKELVNMNLIFKNLSIKNLNPYSSEFIGREILDGKLSLDLKYNIKKSNLDAKNSILISKIKLGKKIKSEKASSLPLDLGIALLEDSQGIIDLNLHIDGNLEDPNFSLGPIVWKVFTNLIINAVTSPFSFLASLIGLEGDDLKNTSFLYGQSIILPYTKEKLDSLSKIFRKRPNIVLLITASYDANKDTYALKKEKFESFLDKELKKSKAKDRYKEVLENLYEENFENIKEIRAKHTKQYKLDIEAYLLQLKLALIPKEKIAIKTLENLANMRVNNIISYLNDKGVQNRRLIKEDKIKIITEKNPLKELLIDFDIDILSDEKQTNKYL